MLPTFFGLELAVRALETQQAAINVSGHNMANANATGYTRQITDMKATIPFTLQYYGKDLSIGTGVNVAHIERARDVFVDRQYRLESSKQQYWLSRQDLLGKVEGIFNESSEFSISGDLEKFWTAWSDLATNPENSGARSVVKGRALALTDTFHYLAQQIEDKKTAVNDNVIAQIDQINLYAQQITDLSNQIKNAQVTGDFPNDLLDKRDNLVDELSKIANIKVIEQSDPRFPDRMVSIYTLVIGDDTVLPQQVLVCDREVNLLKAVADPVTGFATVAWKDNGVPVALGSQKGLLQANLEVRDVYLKDMENELNTIAQGIADAVNALHQTGQGLLVEAVGLNFFTDGSGTTTPPALPLITAANISFNPDLAADVRRISTGAIDDGSGEVKSGDATVANAIASLGDGWAALKDLIAAGAFGAPGKTPLESTSISDYYNAFIARVGVDVQTATRMAESQEMLVYQLTLQREAVSGVNLDEEMTNLIKFQKSYTAAARLVTMFDDMLETVVKGMGITR
ncbi:MAG: flagellar hook-associated protein FlgK [Peptococcaceae bacterium]|jgi:flagellar hook-associated protein 1 FlgK|nr:flagellar hook-associated protein FlgK [Peptococcaceae bacterium]